MGIFQWSLGNMFVAVRRSVKWQNDPVCLSGADIGKCFPTYQEICVCNITAVLCAVGQKSSTTDEAGMLSLYFKKWANYV